jgi:Flp pilus assembly protein TadD
LATGFFSMIVATIATLLPLVVVAIALYVAANQPLKSRIPWVAAAVAILLGGFFIGCSPAWIHNNFIAKDPVFLTGHSGLNYYLGNHSTANGYTRIPTGLRSSQEGLLRDSILIPEREAGRPLLRAEVSEYWKSKGDAWVRNNRSAWMRLLGIKFANFWNSYQYDDLSILKLLKDEGVTLPGLRFGLAAALGLFGLVLCVACWPRSRWVAAAVLLHMAGLMSVFITERYRLAAVPGLLLLGAAGLMFLWEKIVAGAWLAVVVAVGVLSGVIWFVTIPRPEPSFWSLDFYKAGIRNTDGATEAQARERYFRKQAAQDRAQGDADGAQEHEEAAEQQKKLVPVFLDAAEHNLESAIAYVPGNADNYFALGNVWYYRHDNDRARQCYGAALVINPKHDSAYNNLGLIAFEEKRWADVEKFLQQALAIEPEDGDRWHVLAQARFELGDKPGAAQAIAQALKFEPNNPTFREFASKCAPPNEAK